MVEKIAGGEVLRGNEAPHVGHAHRVGREGRPTARASLQDVHHHRIVAVGFGVGAFDVVAQHAPVAVLFPGIAPLRARLCHGSARQSQAIGEGGIVARRPIGVFGVGVFLFAAGTQQYQRDREEEQEKTAFHHGAVWKVREGLEKSATHRRARRAGKSFYLSWRKSEVSDTFSSMIERSESIDTRSCSIVSRWRMVTQPSVSVSWSTVMQ